MGRRYFGNMASKRFQVTLREQLADHYLGVDLAYHRSRPTGDLLTTLDNDVERATEALAPVPLSLSVVVLAAVSVTSLVADRPAPGARGTRPDPHGAGRATTSSAGAARVRRRPASASWVGWGRWRTRPSTAPRS